MEQNKQKVLDQLNSEKIRHLYANTYFSLTNRLCSYGLLPESFVPGRYGGNFVRSTGAYALLMLELGNVELARRSLAYALDIVQKNHLLYMPHVIGSVNPNGRNNRERVDDLNQTDCTAHILLAFGELVLHHNGEDFLEKYWDMLSLILDIHTSHPYFFANTYSVCPVSKINLFLNPSLEHSREHRCWCVFDLLTQSFMGAALERFIQLAENRNDSRHVKRWQDCLDLLKKGIREHLTVEMDGKLCYAEMREPNSNDGTLYDGVSWVNLSPIAADWEALSPDIMENTVMALRKRMWREDPLGGGLHYLDMDSMPEGKPGNIVLGKSVGWDMEAALRLGDYAHIADHFDFILSRHTGDFFAEDMRYKDGTWVCGDGGNAEQCIWWCRALARLRKELGLSPLPDEQDVTHPVYPKE